MLESTYFEISICAERPLTALAEKGVTDRTPRHIHLFEGERFTPIQPMEHPSFTH